MKTQRRAGGRSNFLRANWRAPWRTGVQRKIICIDLRDTRAVDGELLRVPTHTNAWRTHGARPECTPDRHYPECDTNNHTARG